MLLGAPAGAALQEQTLCQQVEAQPVAHVQHLTQKMQGHGASVLGHA